MCGLRVWHGPQESMGVCVNLWGFVESVRVCTRLFQGPSEWFLLFVRTDLDLLLHILCYPSPLFVSSNGGDNDVFSAGSDSGMNCGHVQAVLFCASCLCNPGPRPPTSNKCLWVVHHSRPFVSRCWENAWWLNIWTCISFSSMPRRLHDNFQEDTRNRASIYGNDLQFYWSLVEGRQNSTEENVCSYGGLSETDVRISQFSTRNLLSGVIVAHHP